MKERVPTLKKGNEPEQGNDPVLAVGETGLPCRKALRLSQGSLVKTGFVAPDQQLPLVMEPNVTGLNLVTWARDNREYITAELSRFGALLFRSFNVSSARQFERFVGAISDGALEYTERSSPRSHVTGNIYTSTDYPHDQAIFLHNEQSYNLTFPKNIFFYCAVAASNGGETPIANTRRVFARIEPPVRDLFINKGYTYVRNFGHGFGLPWQEAFQTADKRAVENYCRKHGISAEWKEGNRLTTRQVRPVVARHPQTRERIWFNHATFFHISTVEPEFRARMLAEFGEEGLPNNTYYGDGLPIEPKVIEHLRNAYLSEKVSFRWHAGDVLLLDNMLTCHGREPFEGPREVFVGMADLTRWENVKA